MNAKEKQEKTQTASEIKCISCKYSKLQPFGIGDYVGKTLPNACPLCKSDLVITGIYEFTGDVTKAPEFVVLEQIEQSVNAEFVVASKKIENNAVLFRVQPRYDIEQSFERLKLKFTSLGYLPMIAEENGKLLVAALPRPKVEPKMRSPLINLGLLIVTLGTTFVAGYILSERWAPQLENALLFAFGLMAIIGFHELGHTIMARKYGVKATLPFFVPAPPLPFPLGTFGAVISMRSPIPSRKALFDIGAAGPIAGLLVTLPIVIIGLKMSIIGEPIAEAIRIPIPVLMMLLAKVMGFGPAEGQVLYLHPLAFAGWAGLIVTMLNLMPAGQLDGGHVARAIFRPKSHKWLTFPVIFWLFMTGWWIMALLVFWLSWYEHPRPLNDASKIDNKRKILAIFLLIILILSTNPPELPVFKEIP